MSSDPRAGAVTEAQAENIRADLAAAIIEVVRDGERERHDPSAVRRRVMRLLSKAPVAARLAPPEPGPGAVPSPDGLTVEQTQILREVGKDVDAVFGNNDGTVWDCPECGTNVTGPAVAMPCPKCGVQMVRRGSPDGGDLPALTEQYLDERVKRGQVPPSRVELVRDFSRWLAARGVGVSRPRGTE